VTVEYERHIGRRETGQSQSGDYEGTATRSLPGTMDEVLDGWVARLPAEPGPAFDGVAFAAEPSVSRTEKWRYWARLARRRIRVTVTISRSRAARPRPVARR